MAPDRPSNAGSSFSVFLQNTAFGLKRNKLREPSLPEGPWGAGRGDTHAHSPLGTPHSFHGLGLQVEEKSLEQSLALGVFPVSPALFASVAQHRGLVPLSRKRLDWRPCLWGAQLPVHLQGCSPAPGSLGAQVWRIRAQAFHPPPPSQRVAGRGSSLNQ